jgi:hypothetical protein
MRVLLVNFEHKCPARGVGLTRATHREHAAPRSPFLAAVAAAAAAEAEAETVSVVESASEVRFNSPWSSGSGTVKKGQPGLV